MRWSIKTINIATFPKKTVVTSCLIWMVNITKRHLRIKKTPVASKDVPSDSESNVKTRVIHKKKSRTGVLPIRKKQGNNTPKHKGYKLYCVMCKKAGITERKYKSHILVNCYGRKSNQESTKEVLRGILGNRNKYVKQL